MRSRVAISYRPVLLGLLALFGSCLLGCNEPQKPAPPPVAEPATPPPAPPPAPAPVVETPKVEATPENVEQAEEALQEAADRSRRMRATLTYEEFRATVYREPFEGGKFIVNGDTPVANEKQLREFYDKNVKPKVPTSLIVDQVGGMDNKWNQTQKRHLTYCVSSAFGSRHANVVAQMTSATGSWEEISAVDFIYDATQDANCKPSNAAVVFDVNPVDAGGEYLARAFFPNDTRSQRNVLIDETSFDLTPGEKLSLAGILRHELGHALGFRHEHTRPESGKCFEDRDWKPLTAYDAFSVMHYPQCNGRGDWSLTLTSRDKNGVACLYGAVAPFVLDTTMVSRDCFVEVPAPIAAAQEQTQSFAAQTVAKAAVQRYGPFTVVAGSLFEATLGGAASTGDPDLYVRLGKKPDVNAYDCRPYADGPEEVCGLTVPAGITQVFVMVRGYSEATYDLSVKFTGPAPGGNP